MITNIITTTIRTDAITDRITDLITDLITTSTREISSDLTTRTEQGAVFPVEGQTTGRRTAPLPSTGPQGTILPTPIKEKRKLSTFYSLVDKNNTHDFVDKNVSVKGSLKAHSNFWHSINANQYVLDVIENGYRLPFLTTPEGCFLKNNKSSLDNPEFVQEAIQDLLNSGSVVKTTEKPLVINPLTVAKSKNKLRLVLDLRHVNLHLWKENIKFEDWKTALDYYSKNCYLYDFDLKSGYHHIDIHSDDQKYLGFCWKIDNKEHYFKFTVLPFGLSTAGHVFTKVLRCMVKHWREQSIRIIMYLDDGIGIEEDYDTALVNSTKVKQDLKDAGLIENVEKSNWEPQFQLTWLGISVDSKECVMYVPEKKVDVINFLLDEIIKNNTTTARKLASLAGKINSTNLVLGSITNMMLKHCHRSIVTRFTWDSFYRIDEKVLEELRFWKENFTNLNVRKLSECKAVTRIVFSDASAVGAGGYVVDVQGAQIFRQWEIGEELRSSTWRELKGVYICLKNFNEILRNNTVRWYTDNQGVVSIVQNGSMKEDLHDLAILIYKHCIQNSISLKVDWVPRSGNTVADQISRNLDTDDWEVNTSMFQYLNKLWGHFTVDLFADTTSRKVKRFYSRHWVQNSQGVDAFAFSWKNENCWIVPPVRLIPQVLRKLLFDKSKGTLVVPRWPSSVFWPLLVDKHGEFRWFVIDKLIFTNCSSLLKAGRNCKLFSENFTGAMLVLKVDASW